MPSRQRHWGEETTRHVKGNRSPSHRQATAAGVQHVDYGVSAMASRRHGEHLSHYKVRSFFWAGQENGSIGGVAAVDSHDATGEQGGANPPPLRLDSSRLICVIAMHDANYG